MPKQSAKTSTPTNIINLTWKVESDDYLLGSTQNFKLNSKIAAFDLDGTIIKVKSGKKFPTDSNDWLLLYHNIPEKIKELINSGYCFIIISNQSGLSGTRESEWKIKLKQIIELLGQETMVLCAKAKNKFRKPQTGFFDQIISDMLKNQNILTYDIAKTFYCGDACGRLSDHSDCDLKFAKNLGIKFHTPEELFQDQQVIIPNISYPLLGQLNHEDYDQLKFTPLVKDLLIMVGYPASGKSYFSQLIHTKYNYNVINQDTLKTKKKCLKELEISLGKNLQVIIDNTNPSKESRSEYIEIGKKYKYNIRLVHIETTYELAMHRNYYRMLQKNYLIPEIAYRIYKKNFQQPTVDEKVDEVLIYKPQIVSDPLYNKYLF